MTIPCCLTRPALVLACSLVFALPLAGCGDGKPSIDTSLTEATVTGVVSVKGKPASGGKILYNPSNSGRIIPTKEAPIGTDGSYTIKTNTGLNLITFSGEVASKNPGVGLMKEYADIHSG